MNNFKQFLIEKNTSGIFYRGIEGQYDPNFDKNSNLIWVTQNKNYAELYGEELIKYKVNIKNPFDFKYRTLKVDVKLKDIFSRIQVQLMEAFEQNKLSRKTAIEIDDWFDMVQQKYKSQENKFKEVWQWYMSIKEIPQVLTKMGYDAIIGNEGNNNDIITYGVFNNKQLKKVD